MSTPQDTNDSDDERSLIIEWINSNGEKEGSKTPVHIQVATDPPVKCRCTEERSKAAHDPFLV